MCAACVGMHPTATTSDPLGLQLPRSPQPTEAGTGLQRGGSWGRDGDDLVLVDGRGTWRLVSGERSFMLVFPDGIEKLIGGNLDALCDLAGVGRVPR